MHKIFFQTAALLGALSVALGAFGAHALKKVVDANALATFETGVRYQFYHVFALLALALAYQYLHPALATWAGRLFIAGIVLFSGSLYLLTFAGAKYKFIGAITPFGGLCFIGGWVLLMVALVKKV